MTDTIKRRHDGSIDTAHYMARGRRMRADAARRMVPRAPREPARGAGIPMWLLLAALLVGTALPFAA